MSEVESPVRDAVSVNEFGVRVKEHMGWDAYLDKLVAKDKFEDGTERPDPVPMQPPLGYVRQPTMVEHIRNMIRSENLRVAAESAGAESFAEADDFNVDDDPEPFSKYDVEEVFEPPVAPEPATAAAAATPAAAAPVPGASGAAAVPVVPEPAKAV